MCIILSFKYKMITSTPKQGTSYTKNQRSFNPLKISSFIQNILFQPSYQRLLEERVSNETGTKALPHLSSFRVVTKREWSNVSEFKPQITQVSFEAKHLLILLWFVKRASFMTSHKKDLIIYGAPNFHTFLYTLFLGKASTQPRSYMLISKKKKTIQSRKPCNNILPSSWI